MTIITHPNNHIHRALAIRLKEQQRYQKVPRYDQFFTGQRDCAFHFDPPVAPEPVVKSALVLRAGTRKVRINYDAEVMMAVFPAWPDIAQKGRSGVRVIKNVSFDEPEAEFAIKLLVRIAHGDHHLQNSLKTATGKQLFCVGEIWKWFGEPKFLLNSNEPFLPPDMIISGVENLINKADGLNKVQDWLLLGMVAERLGILSVAEAVAETIILSVRADGQIVIDKALESMTSSQFAAMREVYPNRQSLTPWNAQRYFDADAI
jgi:hypothetical protein